MSSDLVAFDGVEFFNPVTGEGYDDATGQSYVTLAHNSGQTVEGVDSAVAIGQGSISDAQNQANLDAAAAQALTQLGMGAATQANWTKQQAANYITTLQSIVLANPANFTAQTIKNAQNFDVNAYIASYGNSGVPTTGAQVGQAIKAALNAVTTSANVLQWALPLAVIVFFYFAAQSVGKDPGGQAKKSLEGVGALY